MTVLTITVQDLVGVYPVTPLTANAADITWTAAGASYLDGARFAHTGRELILVRNDTATEEGIFLTQQPDRTGRWWDTSDPGDYYIVQPGQYAAFGPFPVEGWRDEDGYLYMVMTAATMYVAVLRVAANYP